MSGYIDFAQFYDQLMSNVQYKERAEYVLSFFQKFDRKPKLMLDVGCGTGEFVSEFSKRNIECIGVDPSEYMLLSAREKCPAFLFLQQKAENLDLFGTVDGAVSLMDSLNHITDYDSLKTAVSKISLFLEPQRLFVFDINTEYKHKNILADNAYIYEYEDVFCSWRNFTDENLLTEISLDFFIKRNNGTYERFCDDFSEKAYSSVQIEEALKKAGLEILAIFDDMTFDSPKPTSERLYYVTRKVK